jgi:hypothetical protein
MIGRSNMLPVALAVVIFMLALIAITSGRSNQPEMAGNDDYPHHVCTYAEYCEGPDCTKDPSSFVLYIEYEDGRPFLDMPRTAGSITVTETVRGLDYETSSGEISGKLSLYPNRYFDWVGTSGPASDLVEHYGTGRCERLRTP